MYKSPVEFYIEDIQHQMVKQMDEEMYQVVLHYVPNVDKDELIRALQYDREQYVNGYADGQRDATAHAHWVYDPNGCDWGIGAYRCSRCDCRNGGLPCNEDAHVYSYANSHYCPYCGAKMDEEVADG